MRTRPCPGLLTILLLTLLFVDPARSELIQIQRSLPELDGTYLAGVDFPQIEIPVEIPSNVTDIGVATLSATVERVDGVLRCCYPPSDCGESVQAPDLLLEFANAPECPGVYLAENRNDDLLPPEILEQFPTLWSAELDLWGATPSPDCPNYPLYLIGDPVLRVRVRVEPDNLVLACSWAESARIEVSDVVIRIAARKTVRTVESSWGAVKSLYD